MAKQVNKKTATPQRSAAKPAATSNEYTLTVLSGQPSTNRIVSKSAVKRSRPSAAKKVKNAKVAAKKAAPKKTVVAKKAAPKRVAAPKKAAKKPVAKKAGKR